MRRSRWGAAAAGGHGLIAAGGNQVWVSSGTKKIRYSQGRRARGRQTYFYAGKEINDPLPLRRLIRRLLRPDRRHGIASAHFICPSKPSDVAMAW